MPRSPRSSDDLAKVSEHLYYEIEMFHGTASGLASGVAGTSVLNNALVESFTLHARALLDFLYAENARDNHVVAEDFVSDWVSKRPNKSSILNNLHVRVGKEIAHLTYARLLVGDDKKPWQYMDIAKEICRVLDSFVQFAPPNVLGERMTNYKASRQNVPEISYPE